jgi:hypothetical protein
MTTFSEAFPLLFFQGQSHQLQKPNQTYAIGLPVAAKYAVSVNNTNKCKKKFALYLNLFYGNYLGDQGF